MAKIDADLPAMVDDDGTGRTGTRENVAFFETWRDAVNNQTYSATNPAVTPAEIIDEVVEARAAYPSLDLRLDDLALASSVATNITQAQFMGGLGGVNLLGNDDFLVWPSEAGGDGTAQTVGPALWAISGAAGTVTRTGTGLGDTSRKVGDFAAKVTRAGTNVNLSNILLQGAAFSRADFLKTKYIAAGMWVLCSTPNIARVAISDNVGTTYSSYHTGGGTWEWLPVTRQINNAATAIIVAATVHNSDGNAVFSGASAILLDSSFTLEQYQPSPCLFGTMHFAVSGNIAGATNVGRFDVARCGIVKDVQCHLKTAPTGQAAIFDVNTWDGASQTSMFSTRPQIAATANRGGAQPDTTYARRCLAPQVGSVLVLGGHMTLDVDQVGSGTAGADLGVEVRVLQYASPLERFQTY